ncbi:conserved hypothetical protein [Microbacterium sp. 8M]|uniref:hypothetical protein n=1 Tax=Microbacterium sp. 8M TaxID=2653153 RepID=UPI0012F264D3|nr:hypothetical protein [Microbacterium sp. 8M]VXC30468.1 conserved hypothetical protein [Microbacterium sp. 8M]
MTRRDNPNDSEIPEILRRIRALETQSPIGFSSITRGALRVASPEGLLVEGSAYVSGILHGDGDFNWSGDMNLTGSQHVTGPTVFDGTLTINGNTTINGTTTVNGPLNVVGTWKLIGNGEIQGNTVITGSVIVNSPGLIRITGGASPATLEDGRMSFGTGGVVEADVTNGGVRMNVGTNRVYVGTGAVAIQRGGVSIVLSGSGISFFGMDTIPSASANHAPVGTIWTDGTGKVFEVV